MDTPASNPTKKLSDIVKLREAYWKVHPAIERKAVIATPPVMAVCAIVLKEAICHRSAAAFWAHPLTGKSSCIVALTAAIRMDFPESTVYVYEPTKKDRLAEGAFIEDMLAAFDYEPKLARSLAGKRSQLLRFLYATTTEAKHLFLVVDEAQELLLDEFLWLKTVINWLVRRKIKVTVVLFGQRELLDVRRDMLAKGRSDLSARYLDKMYQFEDLATVTDLRDVLAAYDDPERSEFPANSQVSYTQFLWPRAYKQGFRLSDHAQILWDLFFESSPVKANKFSLSMRWVANIIAELAHLTIDADSSGFRANGELWMRALDLTEYRNNAAELIVRSSVPKATH